MAPKLLKRDCVIDIYLVVWNMCGCLAIAWQQWKHANYYNFKSVSIHVVFCVLWLVINMQAVADQLPRLGKRELICLLSFTCNYVVSVREGFLFLLVLGMNCVNFIVAFPGPSI